MKLSVSQLKKYNASPAEWAGQYILGIQPSYGAPESMIAGNLIEEFVTKGNFNELRLAGEVKKYAEKGVEVDVEKVMDKFNAAIKNYGGEQIEGEYQVFVSHVLHGIEFIGYIDALQNDKIIDIKTTQYCTKSLDSVSMFSGLSKRDEYELQLWFYMKATGKKKASIIEISTHKYKKEGEYRQELVMDWTDDMDNKWISWTKKKTTEMKALRDKHKK